MKADSETVGLDWRLFRRLYARSQPYAGQRRIVFVTTTIRAFQRPLLFWATAAVINGPIAAHDYRRTLVWTLGFFALALSTALVAHLRSRHQNELGERLVHDLRNDLLDNLLRQPADYFTRTKLGRILSRVVTDLEATRRGVQLVVFIGQEYLQLAICCVLLLAYNWVLLVLILGVAPLLFWLGRTFHSRIHRSSHAAAESNSRLTGALAESVRGIRVTQSFIRQPRSADAFDGYVGRLAEDNVTLAAHSALYAPLLGLTGQVFLASVLVVGGYCVWHGLAGLKIETLVASFFLPMSFFQSLQAAAGYYPQILAAQVGSERVLALIDLLPEWQDQPGAADLPDPRLAAESPAESSRASEVSPQARQAARGARVEFQQVSFAYQTDRPVLRDIDLLAAPGETVALVGHTGSGKSTLVGLLAKFYVPQQGCVLIDGHDSRSLRSESLRRQMGIVHQTNFLFSGTVRDNLRFARPEASDNDVSRAAASLDCLDLLENLPHGFATEVGERGSRLSLGQRQLVCFVRALLADPRILILDEATSAVDVVTERRLQRALERLLAGRTSFVIAHRLSTVVRADQILVLDQGRIVERGHHHRLLALGGVYQNLYRQFALSGLSAESADDSSGPKQLPISKNANFSRTPS